MGIEAVVTIDRPTGPHAHPAVAFTKLRTDSSVELEGVGADGAAGVAALWAPIQRNFDE